LESSDAWTPTRNETVSVGVTSVLVAKPRNQSPNRRNVILVRNTSTSATAVITIHTGEGAAVANEGIVLKQNESFYEAMDAGFEPFQGAYTAISNEAGAQLSVFER
jgi:hypothetical protein